MPPLDLPHCDPSSSDAPSREATYRSATAPSQPLPPTDGVASVIAAGWQASLQLGFATRASGTFLAQRRHSGPLRVQKPLYPEGPTICHAVIVHPPGGVAGGDALRIDVDVAANSHAVLATPGATKWYKSNRRSAGQHISLSVGPGACLDWLPQNNILFDNAHIELDLTLSVADTGSAIGWEATQLGRQASGEPWRSGSLHARTTLRRPDGQLLWTERAMLNADDPLRDAPQGLDGWSAFGTLWAIGGAGGASHEDSGNNNDGNDGGKPVLSEALHQQLIALLPYDDDIRSGMTIMPEGVILIRVVARKMERLQALLVQCWNMLRPAIHHVPAQPLRLWQT